MKKYDQKRLGKEMIEKARLHLSKQLNSVYFLQLHLNQKKWVFMSARGGGRAARDRKGMSDCVEILLLRKLGNYTETLMGAKEVPPNIEGKWRSRGKGV